MPSILRDSQRWYADGTFKVVPQQFYQLYTLHAEKEDIPNLRNGTEPYRKLLIPNLRNGTDKARLLQLLPPFTKQESYEA